MGDTSGDFKRIVVSLCAARRDEQGDYLGEETATALAQVILLHSHWSKFIYFSIG